MTKTQFERLCYEALELVRQRCPRDTGNLRTHGINAVWIDEETFFIYVDEDVAPYMPYTNEPWISDKWKSASNPNEAWWEDATQIVMTYFMSHYDGERTDND